MQLFPKAILSPFLTVVFAVISVTGGLLFFHIKNGMIMTLHQWLGWAFVVVGCAHLLLNFKSLTAYLRMPKGVASLVVALGLAVALACVGAHRKGAPGHRGPQDLPPSGRSATTLAP